MKCHDVQDHLSIKHSYLHLFSPEFLNSHTGTVKVIHSGPKAQPRTPLHFCGISFDVLWLEKHLGFHSLVQKKIVGENPRAEVPS